MSKLLRQIIRLCMVGKPLSFNQTITKCFQAEYKELHPRFNKKTTEKIEAEKGTRKLWSGKGIFYPNPTCLDVNESSLIPDES